MSGGEQFFSNYLRAFKETVDKQTEIVGKLEEIYLRLSDIVPKFAMPSDNIQATKDYSLKLVNGGVHTISSWVNGSIKLKVNCTPNTNLGTSMRIKINGILITGTELLTSGLKNLEFEVDVKEGDKITIEVNASSSNYITINKIQSCYDLISRPDFIV